MILSSLSLFVGHNLIFLNGMLATARYAKRTWYQVSLRHLASLSLSLLCLRMVRTVRLVVF